MTKEYRYQRSILPDVLDTDDFQAAGGVLKVKLLWVADKHRGSGLGREIMTAVDALGRKRGATFATVNTFSFQAEGFYKKCGYDVLYRVPGCFDGSVEKIFLGKKL
ncbi:GLUCOSAMINE 6-PHOSPHATE N-ACETYLTRANSFERASE [Ceraceosorus bombacis]|uniref:GLUCOSAMINE 6-PHOSPHATE N-ACETYLTRANSFERASE n=1 Tax=Ceraceosorus bombacis TaxID=401625 RepID=A0A0P1BQ51_9BASI|nr:GLUCOSAMINE 6-PHOSPHATE N-ACETYLTRANSFERASE [Ceraceosorus bombacis]